MDTAVLLVGLIALILTVFAWIAYIMKSMTAAVMLHAVNIITWIITGYLLFNQTYTGNTYIPTAVGLVGFAMALVEVVGLLLAAGIPEKMRSRRNPDEVYENDKAASRQKIYKITKRKEKKWYE